MTEAILQSDAGECGLACLAMVTRAFGGAVALRELRQRMPHAGQGLTLRQLAGLAQQLGLVARPLRLDLEDLKALAKPCILHWDLNHYVVLHRVRRRGVEVLDPAVGRRQLSWAEVSRHFTGVALETLPSPAFERRSTAPVLSLRALVRRIHGFREALLPILVMAILLELVVLALPLVQQIVIDEVLGTGDGDLLWAVTAGGLSLLLMQAVLSGVRSLWVRRLAHAVALQGHVGLFSHLLSLSPSFIQRRPLGDHASRFESLGAIQQAFVQGLPTAFIDGLLGLAAWSLMLLYSPTLAAIVLIGVVAQLSLRIPLEIRLRRLMSERLVASAAEQTHFLETLRSVATLKILGRQSERLQQWQQHLVGVLNRDHQSAQWMSTLRIGLLFIQGCEQLALLVTGAALILQASSATDMPTTTPMTVGMLVAFLAWRMQFVGRLTSLLDALHQWRTLRIHLERVADLALEPPEEPQRVGSAPASLASERDLPARLELRGIGFRHGPDEPWILRGVNLTVEPGECVAITGPSGVGKSTLIRLALGLLTPTEGEVHYGGMEIRRLGLGVFRSKVGAVLQDDLLFSGSVADNICAFAPEPDRGLVERCARQAQLHEDIMRWPMGYLTPVGEGGAGLSGGQRQRLMLARALYREPKLLILDEATSHLDLDTERAVNDVVRTLAISRLVVAHRPQTIAAADRVVSLQGVVAPSG